MQNPRQYKIPDWFLNRQKDVVDGKFSQVCKFELICSVFKIQYIYTYISLLAKLTYIFLIYSLPLVPLTANCVKIWKG
jgi:hypothetical protein